MKSREKLLKLLRTVKQTKASEDLFYFTKKVLGYSDLERSVHGKLCKLLEDQTIKRKLILLPRSSFKSTIVTTAYSIWSLIKNPNLRILLENEIWTNAKNFLKSIRLQFETNNLLHLLFGDFVSERGWLDESLTIKKRTEIFKEASIDIGSLGHTNVSMHYDKIICDDLQSDKTVKTALWRQEVIDHYKLLEPILEPDGELVVVGTRWHWADLYSYILEQNKTQNEQNEQSKKFVVYIEKAIRDDGSLFFPKRLSKEHLDDKLIKLGSYYFSAQYQNNPTPIEAAFFKNVNYYRSLEEIPKDTYIVVTVDPAISESPKADFTAILVSAIDTRFNIWVLDYINAHLDPYKLIQAIFLMRNKWHPNTIGLETISFQKVLKYILEQEEQKVGVFLPIEQIQDTKKSKEMRIIGLQPHFEQGKIFIRTNMYELEEQIFTFPKSKYDDLLDALSMVLQIGRVPMKTQEEIYQETIELKPWLRRPKNQNYLYDEILGSDW